MIPDPPVLVRFRSGIGLLDRCHDLAVETLRRNIKPWKDGLLDEPAPSIMAGETYKSPWTRDCAFNVWNAAALLTPEAALNTLLSTLTEDDGLVRIGGQYWDAIAWTTGAWHYYCVTGDEEFLELAHAATVNSLRYFEETELEPDTGLFQGPASYGDGVAAYPEPYNDAGGSSGVLDWPAAHPEIGKIRMKALSTNCLYVNAYWIADLMGRRLGLEPQVNESLRARGDAVRDAINRQLWLPDKGRYAYFTDPAGRCEEYMEGLGHAFAVLFGIASPEQARAVLTSQYVSAYGIPCVWPVFPWFTSLDGMSFGRHSGTIWPFIQGFWASAAAKYGNAAAFDKELTALAEMADRHHEFKEIYHPTTGEPYGGLQVDRGKVRMWASEPHQTWSATGYLRMIYNDLFGMRFESDALRFEPFVPPRFKELKLTGVAYRGMTLDVTVRNPGARIAGFTLDGERHEPEIPVDLEGQRRIVIDMA
jgi:hypothetical protein